MGQVIRYNGSYVLNQVDYPRKELGGYATNSYDIVCQVKQNGSEICHCTWHPDGTLHCKDKYNSSMSPSSCPCYGCHDCLR